MASSSRGAVTMSPLPTREGLYQETRAHTWDGAVGNIEDAKLACEALRELIDDAVFLDEEAYANAHTAAVHQQRIQSQAKRIKDLELDVTTLRLELEQQYRKVQQYQDKEKQWQLRFSQLQEELDNNTEVFKMHYQELITRNDEIARLKAIIEGLQ